MVSIARRRASLGDESAVRRFGAGRRPALTGQSRRPPPERLERAWGRNDHCLAVHLTPARAISATAYPPAPRPAGRVTPCWSCLVAMRRRRPEVARATPASGGGGGRGADLWPLAITHVDVHHLPARGGDSAAGRRAAPAVGFLVFGSVSGNTGRFHPFGAPRMARYACTRVGVECPLMPRRGGSHPPRIIGAALRRRAGLADVASERWGGGGGTPVAGAGSPTAARVYRVVIFTLASSPRPSALVTPPSEHRSSCRRPAAARRWRRRHVSTEPWGSWRGTGLALQRGHDAAPPGTTCFTCRARGTAGTTRPLQRASMARSITSPSANGRAARARGSRRPARDAAKPSATSLAPRAPVTTAAASCPRKWRRSSPAARRSRSRRRRMFSNAHPRSIRPSVDAACLGTPARDASVRLRDITDRSCCARVTPRCINRAAGAALPSATAARRHGTARRLAAASTQERID